MHEKFEEDPKSAVATQQSKGKTEEKTVSFDLLASGQCVRPFFLTLEEFLLYQLQRSGTCRNCMSVSSIGGWWYGAEFFFGSIALRAHNALDSVQAVSSSCCVV